MINTKLILVDGLPGSGKSTIAHFLARQMELNDIKVKWIYETIDDHPLEYHVKEFKLETFLDEFESAYPDHLQKFIDQILKDEYTYIIDSSLFKEILGRDILLDQNQDRIFSNRMFEKVCSILKPLNSVYILLYQNDVEKSIDNICTIRGKAWGNSYINAYDGSIISKKRNLKGKKALLGIMQEISDLALKLFPEMDIKKLLIENSKLEWDQYRKQILDFLELKQVEEKLFDTSFEEYCGEYLGIKIHINNKRLCIDSFWPNLKLIPVDNDVFEFEGFPIKFKFIRDENKIVRSIKIISAYRYFKDGEEIPKKNCKELNSSELNMFCGEYQAVEDKKARKILLKDSKLVYIRNGNMDQILKFIDKNTFVCAGTSIRLTFNQKNKIKSFVLSSGNKKEIAYEKI
ncbi:MAG: hypothetical protein PF638_15795 [Candidatus Delongbacteria bacterium]|jgi:hypothetical protein|nr:hypothetical protein [Candidatus Delongbacteria bacterium]